MYFFFFFFLLLKKEKKKKKGGGGGGGEGGRTNERPGTDHVTSGPMKGLEKKMHPMAHTHRHPDMATL